MWQWQRVHYKEQVVHTKTKNKTKNIVQLIKKNIWSRKWKKRNKIGQSLSRTEEDVGKPVCPGVCVTQDERKGDSPIVALAEDHPVEGPVELHGYTHERLLTLDL